VTGRVSRASTSRVLELGCWGLGTVLLGLYYSALAFGESGRRGGIAEFAEIRAATELAATTYQPTPQRGEAAASETATPSQLEAPDGSTPTPAELNAAVAGSASPERPEAVLRIQRVGLEVPVYADVGERNLIRGAGLIAGTGLPGSRGNVAIAAHRDGYFRALEHVVLGDLIALESLSGIQRYRVTELSVVEPDDLSPLRESEIPAVTLVTCYPFYFVGYAPQRYIVRAVATD